MIEQKSLKFQKLAKNTRLIALEIWILIFYKNKNFEKTIDNSFDFNKLDKTYSRTTLEGIARIKADFDLKNFSDVI